MRYGLLAGLLGACSFQHGTVPDAGGTPPSDVAPADGPPDAPLGPWGQPSVVALAPPTSSDDDPSPTDDRLELYINSSRDGNVDVYVATRASTSDAWSVPAVVPIVSSSANETTPEVSYDGLTMIVASDRAGTAGGNDLWQSTRVSRLDTWDTPVRIAELSSTASEAGGNMSPDGLAVVFSSTRTGNGSPDLFYAERDSPTAAWREPIELTAINTDGHEGSPFLSADKLTLFFDTDRTGSLDLYMSRRASTSDPFPSPVPIVELNGPDNEQDPWVSLDGRRLWFSSNRGGTNQLWEATR